MSIMYSICQLCTYNSNNVPTNYVNNVPTNYVSNVCTQYANNVYIMSIKYSLCQ